MLRSESSSRMWIGAVCGLLASDHVYSQGNQHNRKKKRTSAVGTRQVLGPVQLFRWFEGKRKKVRDETCRKRKVLSVDEVVPEAAEGRRCTDGVGRVSGRRTASIRSVILRSPRDAFVLSPLPSPFQRRACTLQALVCVLIISVQFLLMTSVVCRYS